jgi:polyhydroxybutyrate depolymerase
MTGDGPPPVPTSGCGSAGRTGQWQQEIEVPGVGTRSFFVSVPASYDPDVPQSVYFAVHGTGWTGAMIQPYYNIEGGTNEIYIYPDRDPGFDNLQTTGEQAESDLLYFDALVEWASSGYCVDENRLFALGHSGGGNWVTFLSCRRGDVLRAVVPTGTGGAWWYVGGVGDCQGPIDAMVVHGRQDQIIPYDPWGLETLDYFRTLNGCGTNSTEAYGGTSCVRMDGCGETYDCSHDEPTFLGDGHQIPDWHPEVMTWLRSL